jgi:4-carboxymuconolactone decarboxylase
MTTPSTSTRSARPARPRIPPVDLASLTAEQRGIAGIGASTVIQTLVHRPDLLDAVGPLGAKLLTEGRLPVRDRELVILRVALHTECAYEWGNHVPGALAGGATTEEIRALTDESASWATGDEALLRAADELCTADCVSDETWASLREALDDGQLIELLFVVGYYRMMAGFLNSAGVQVEPGRAPLGTVPEPFAEPSTAQARPTTGHGPVDGQWHITFHHPAGDQQLTLEMTATDGVVTGSVSNPALGVVTPLSEGAVENSRVTATTVLTEPIAMTIEWDGTVTGDVIVGTVTLVGTGSFPFDGTRA